MNTTVIKPATAETVYVTSWGELKTGKLVVDYVKFHQGAYIGPSSTVYISEPIVKILKIM